jgi:hypothetical protein
MTPKDSERGRLQGPSPTLDTPIQDKWGPGWAPSPGRKVTTASCLPLSGQKGQDGK